MRVRARRRSVLDVGPGTRGSRRRADRARVAARIEVVVRGVEGRGVADQHGRRGGQRGFDPEAPPAHRDVVPVDAVVLQRPEDVDARHRVLSDDVARDRAHARLDEQRLGRTPERAPVDLVPEPDQASARRAAVRAASLHDAQVSQLVVDGIAGRGAALDHGGVRQGEAGGRVRVSRAALDQGSLAGCDARRTVPDGTATPTPHRCRAPASRRHCRSGS